MAVVKAVDALTEAEAQVELDRLARAIADANRLVVDQAEE